MTSQVCIMCRGRQIAILTVEIFSESTTAPLDSQNDVGSDAACSEYECFNGGSCVTLTNDDPICVCLDDYEGGRCQNSRNGEL